jgi:hypothetical protein
MFIIKIYYKFVKPKLIDMKTFTLLYKSSIYLTLL